MDCIEFFDDNCPIEFRDSVEYNGKVYLEVKDKEVPNIVPNRYYIATDGEMYSKNKGGGIKKHRLGERYYTNEVRLNDGGRRHITEHLLEMQVYANNPNIEKDKLEINHIDGNRYNNSLSNLEWCTRKENMHHAYKTGLNKNYSEDNVCAYLTNEQVTEICRRLQNREFTTLKDLAKEFNCGYGVIIRISTGKYWKRVSDDAGFEPFKLHNRFTDEKVHEMCKIFVEDKGLDFDQIYDDVITKLNLYDNDNTRLRIRNIYFRKRGYFNRITDQYDYL